jgi:hypothetical protein
MKTNQFDRLLDVVIHDKNLKIWPEVLKAANIFNFDKALELNLKADGNTACLDVRLPEFDHDLLGLPFKVTAMVFKDACTIFCDIEDSDRYAFISLNIVDTARLEKDHIHLVTFGYVDLVRKSGGVGGVIGMKNKNQKWGKVEFPQSDTVSLLPLVYHQLNYLQELNTVDRFIMEISPTNPGVRSNKYIPKAHQRSEYVLLHPHEIRKYMKTEHEAGDRKQSAHERRAHYRTYPDDAVRFPNAHGKRIRIEAVWIGSTEAVVGGKKYKVILD